jgi:BirA family biotin operon repressor/biotin-[acetyl-CoA-carboxylase] ligase
MKSRILKQLKNRGSVVSGEWLSEQLGISRVSVWKHVKKLQDCGYEIVSTNKGYEMKMAPDIPYPWEIEGFEDRVVYFPQVGTTMDEARDLARKGAAHLTVVVADRQTKGRGRLRRKWLSGKGGLYFTVVVRPKISPALSFKVNFTASLALVQVVRELYSVDAAVKWPNDVLVGDGKLCGMLSEMETEADLVNYVNIGMGINVNNSPSGEGIRAVSLKSLLKRNVSRVALLTRFLERFERMARDVESFDVVAEWKKYSGTLRRAVRIVTASGETEGVARDVDETGALLVETSEGKIERVIYGDCFHGPED